MARAPKHPKPRRTGDDLRLVALVALAAVCIVSVVTAVAVLVALRRLDAAAVNTLASGATGVAGMALGRLSGANGSTEVAPLAAPVQPLGAPGVTVSAPNPVPDEHLRRSLHQSAFGGTAPAPPHATPHATPVESLGAGLGDHQTSSGEASRADNPHDEPPCVGCDEIAPEHGDEDQG